MPTKLLAVSGGIDSMVMMDFLCRRFPDTGWRVVTVDHGTRVSSAADAEFVRRVAMERYGVCCEVLRLGLGEGVSEAEARAARYRGIFEAARRDGDVIVDGDGDGGGAEIFVAQHLDDLAESVAINLLRGTGWRGLAVMAREGVRRPFLDAEFFEQPVDKRWILRYAAENRVIWREDPTNSSDDYLRNRVRPAVREMSYEAKREIFELRERQVGVRREVESGVAELLAGRDDLPREWLCEMDAEVADEVLRAWLICHGITTTQPQRADFGEAIKNYRAGKLFNLPGGKMVKIGRGIKFLG